VSSLTLQIIFIISWNNYTWFKSFYKWQAEFLQKILMNTLLKLVNPKELNLLLLEFFQEIIFKDVSKSNVLSFDGHTNNGSKRALTLNRDEKTSLNY